MWWAGLGSRYLVDETEQLATIKSSLEMDEVKPQMSRAGGQTSFSC